ncbi:MAG: hypothetical protein J1E40_11700 [Oscillospiraceae bacterium]|nr:hypothetical protein [Oscillospiraceae bacterium]
MERITGIFLSVLVTVLFFGGCAGNIPPEETEIRAQLAGEWVNWLGGEDNESIVYILNETEIISQHFSSGILTEQHEGTYSITDIEYDRGSWRGTVIAELGEEVCRIPFRTDRDGKNLALGVSDNINSPGYAKRSRDKS